MTAFRPCGLVLPLALALLAPARADGPADNVADNVRRVPKPGITLAPGVQRELRAALDALQARIDGLPNDDAKVKSHRPDVVVLHRAVRDALEHDEFFAERDVAAARQHLALADRRVDALRAGDASWATRPGLTVRGYVSKIDGSVQPYGLVVPPGYDPDGPGRYRLDVWLHGRGETLSEVNFIDQRLRQPGEFTPPDTLVLHPYGRYCNAFKFAGEVDVLEALEAVKRDYRVDVDRVAVRGFSMGGAACWQFAVHYPDLWFAANPGAGFVETPRFLDVFQRESLAPTWYERKLWGLYDCTAVAVNLTNCPTVAYSGEIDPQKQAADLMTEALGREKIELVHVIGPKTRHAYEPEAKVEVARRMEALAEVGRVRFPREVHLATFTLRYDRSSWVTIDRLDEHWRKARVDASITPDGSIDVRCENVAELTLSFPPGHAPFSPTRPVEVRVDGQSFATGPPRSDRSWEATFHRAAGHWAAGRERIEGPHKVHGLQGPIDDAFMDAFIVVRPTGKSPRARFQAWVESEMARALEHWRRHFRGGPRVVDDTTLAAGPLPDANLVAWGDRHSNALLRRLLGEGDDRIEIAGRSFDPEHHALVRIGPCPSNPRRYLVLNSGFTFREYDYLNNARQTPKLPDWAVIDLRTPPSSWAPGKVLAAGFFDEAWREKPQPER